MPVLYTVQCLQQIKMGLALAKFKPKAAAQAIDEAVAAGIYRERFTETKDPKTGQDQGLADPGDRAGGDQDARRELPRQGPCRWQDQ